MTFDRNALRLGPTLHVERNLEGSKRLVLIHKFLGCVLNQIGRRLCTHGLPLVFRFLFRWFYSSLEFICCKAELNLGVKFYKITQTMRLPLKRDKFVIGYARTLRGAKLLKISFSKDAMMASRRASVTSWARSNEWLANANIGNKHECTTLSNAAIPRRPIRTPQRCITGTLFPIICPIASTAKHGSGDYHTYQLSRQTQRFTKNARYVHATCAVEEHMCSTLNEQFLGVTIQIKTTFR